MMLQICKMLERRLWMDAHPLRQLPTLLEEHHARGLESRRLSLERLADMSASVRASCCYTLPAMLCE